MQRNRIEVDGFIAAQPSRKYLPSGMPVSNVRLGESYTHRDSQGNTQKHTNWPNLSLYGDLSDVALTDEKGDHIFVEGAIDQRKFTPKDGVQRTLHEVIVRRCPLVAAPRAAATKVVESEIAPGDAANRGGEHEPWQVS
jgi:single-strand DNA-binding protein